MALRSLLLTAGSGGLTSISHTAPHLLPSVRSWHTVIGISDGKEHRASGLTVTHARAHRRRNWITATVCRVLSTVVRPPLISFLDNGDA